MSKIWKLIAIGIFMSSAVEATSTAVCKGCHGQGWEKSAMGKSKVVKEMSKAQIIKALNGYKNASYGGKLKGLMKAQVIDLSAKDFDNIATEIKN